MKAIRLRPSANKQLEVEEVMHMEVQLGQRIAKFSFLIVTSLATDMIIETDNITENIEKIISMKTTLKPAGPNPVTKNESVGNTAYMANHVTAKQKNSEDEYRGHACTAVPRTIMLPMREAHL